MVESVTKIQFTPNNNYFMFKNRFYVNLGMSKDTQY